MKKKKILGVIPARLESSRLRRKPLIKIHGIELFAHVFLRAKYCKDLDEIIIATDSKIVADVANKYGFPFILTRKSHKNPSERLCEVSQKIDSDIYVLINGDEPLVRPQDISLSINTLLNSSSDAAMLLVPLKKRNSLSSFKVVTDINDNVMYISRADIPFPYAGKFEHFKKGYHVMSYYKNTLKIYSKLKISKQESMEQHEYLRLIESGVKIKTKFLKYECFSVDTKNDLIWVKNKLKSDSLFKKYQNFQKKY